MTTAINALINAAILSLPSTLAVWLALRLLPRRSLSAAARYIIWWLALLGTLALPAAYLPAQVTTSPVLVSTSDAALEAPVLNVRQIAPPVPPPHTPSQFPLKVPIGNGTNWILAAWAVSTLLLLTRLILSCFALLRRKRAAQPLKLDNPLPRHARVLLSNEIPAPMAAGFLRPAILLPARFFDQLTPDQIQQIVLHESAHLARRDDYALLLQRAIEGTFALHPAIWFIARQLDLEREIACDDRVVQSTGQPTSYAASLTVVAEMSGRNTFAAAAFSHGRSQLSRRVDELLDKARTAPARFLKTRLACVAFMSIAIAWTLAKTPALLAFSTPAPAPIPAPPLPVDPPKSPQLLAQAVPPPAPTPIPAAPIPPAQPISVVVLPVKVTTPTGDSVSGLTLNDFTVLEDGVRQPVTYFALDDSPPALEVVVFNPGILKQQTRDDLAALQTIPGAHVTYVQATDTPTRQSAAEEASSRLQQLPNQHKTLLLFGARQEEIALPVVPNDTTLVVYNARPDPPEEMFRSYLATSYLLGYPARQPGGNYVNVRVLVDRPGLVVRSRTGYYADISRTCSGPVRGAFVLPGAAQCH